MVYYHRESEKLCFLVALNFYKCRLSNFYLNENCKKQDNLKVSKVSFSRIWIAINEKGKKTTMNSKIVVLSIQSLSLRLQDLKYSY